MKLLVVGAGEVGRWFGGAVDADVAFTDIEESVAAAAADATGSRTVATDTGERFDAVCIAVPISATADAIAAHAGRAEAALLDCTGVMGRPLAAMREHAPDRERASLHPLFAPSNTATDERVAVVRDADGPTVDALLADVAEGYDCFETTAAEHDEAMRTVQARAHAAILAYGLAAEEVPDDFHTPVSRPLTELVERVTGGDPAVYAEIQEAFDGAEDVAAAATRLAGADREAFLDLYRDAR
jgi:prephenate dehydrogenase